MRLIRLVSSNPGDAIVKSEFENYFNDNITIKPNAKIGLLSAVLPILSSIIIIDNTCDTFQFSTADNQTYRNVIIQPASYTIQDLITTLTKETWKTLTLATGADIGYLLSFSLQQNKRIRISINRNLSSPFSADPAMTTNVNITVGGGAPTFRRTDQTNPAPDNSAYIYSKAPFLMSCNFLRCRVSTLAQMIIGLTNSAFDGSALTLEDTDFTYAIQIAVVAGVMTYQTLNLDGTYTNQVAALINDFVAIDIELGLVNYRFYRGAGPDPNNLGLPIEITNPIAYQNFAMGLRGATVTCVTSRCIYDPRISLNSAGDLVTVENTGTMYLSQQSVREPPLGALPAPVAGATVWSHINFIKPVLMSKLGFESNILIYQGVETLFVAALNYNSDVLPTSVIVELLNFKLNSYDGEIHTRRNILAILTNQVENDVRAVGRSIFNISNPIMLSLDVAREMNFRSIRARITNGEDGNLLDVYDKIELVVLIDD